MYENRFAFKRHGAELSAVEIGDELRLTIMDGSSGILSMTCTPQDIADLTEFYRVILRYVAHHSKT